MIEQLFGSKTRVKLLQLFFQNPNRSFYVREITRKIDEQINSVRRELANLLSIGLIKSDTNNNRLYYEVNQDFDHYAALSSVFGGKKFKPAKKATATKEMPIAEVAEDQDVQPVVATDDPFIKELLKTGNVSLAVYTGQFTRDDSTGIDLVIVGDINQAAVEKLINDLEITEKKELRYSIFSPDEFKYRREVNDKFLANLKDAKKIVLINKDSLL